MLSVIIAARNEKYLEQTIRNILANAEGDIEVIVELDGYLPDPRIDTGDPRVIFYHHEKSIGQRQCINHGARVAKGKYIMKLDAHCAVDKGFDVKLAADCEYDWTIIPRMYNLDINTFQPKKHKRTDYMYMGCAEGRLLRAEYYSGKEYTKWHRKTELIDDTMCNMGPGWFMHKDRFWELGGLDENHGGWGQMGVEISCKAWLSGGALKVNKKTWFSHWFRGGSGPGFPYPISGNSQERAREYSRDIWLNDKWPLAKRKFQWLIDKFHPPGWNGKNPMSELYVPRDAKSHVHGRAVRVDNLFKNLEHYWDSHRRWRAKDFIKKAIPFFEQLRDGKVFTDEELIKHSYYEYVKSGMSKGTQQSPHIQENCLKVMKNSIDLFHDIKQNGMSTPIEVWVENGKYNISRGTRRIVVLKMIGRRITTLRIYKNRDYMEKLRMPHYPIDDSITGIAVKHFCKWDWKATDKYWLHNYTKLYDDYCGKLRDKATKILEVGVKLGGSLRLWQEAFPKATIYGVDLDIEQAKMAKDIDRIVLLKGSQTDEQFNKDKVIPLGPFDIIVDDASHRGDDQKKGLELLWNSVKPGGYYVIEDLFWRNFHNNENSTFIDTLKGMINELNQKCEISEMHFHYNICFIRKR